MSVYYPDLEKLNTYDFEIDIVKFLNSFETDNNNDYVYLTLCFVTNSIDNLPEFYFKIGVTNNLLNRHKQLNNQYNCHDQIFLIGAIPVIDRKFERDLHNDLKKENLNIIFKTLKGNAREFYEASIKTYEFFFEYFDDGYDYFEKSYDEILTIIKDTKKIINDDDIIFNDDEIYNDDDIISCNSDIITCDDTKFIDDDYSDSDMDEGY